MPDKTIAKPNVIGPGSTLRSVVSLALVLHLICMFVALFGGQAPGGEGDLVFKDRIREKLRWYTQSLNLETFAKYYLTHATADDVDCRIEYLPRGADPTNDVNWIPIAQGTRGSDRLRRHQQLAEIWGYFGEREEEAASAELAVAVGRNLVLQRGLEVDQVRVRKHLLQDRAEVNGSNLERRNPDDASFFREAYRAEIIDLGDGDIRSKKVERAGQEAPVTRTRSSS